MSEEAIVKFLDPEALEKSPQLLDKLLALQFKLQSRMGTWEAIKTDGVARQGFINQMLLAMFEETVEIMKETPYKNPEFSRFGWKRGQVGDLEKMKGEIIDQLHFWLILAIVSGVQDADEIYRRYAEKNGINHDRQDSGY
jgi:dimeric dUTPase (all-alpha-NTP-PPase superfamily)